jgi:hypothetical protein
MPEIQYVGKEDEKDIFHLMADGGDGGNRRPVLIFGVDQENKIWTAALGDVRIWQKTSGTVHRHDPNSMDAEMATWADITGAWDPHTGICMGHFYEHVTPRIVTYMARAYVPLQLSEALGWTAD